MGEFVLSAVCAVGDCVHWWWQSCARCVGYIPLLELYKRQFPISATIPSYLDCKFRVGVLVGPNSPRQRASSMKSNFIFS